MIKHEYLPTVYCWHPVRIWCSWVSALWLKMGLVTLQEEALGQECWANGGSRASSAIYPLAGWVFHGSVVACPSGQRRLWLVERVILPTVSARVGHGARQVWQREAGSQLQSKHVLWCKQGVSKIKNQPSCGWAKPQGQGRAAVGTGLTYAKSGTAGETVAAAEVCDLWHIFSPVTKPRWTKRKVPAGCPGLLRSSLQPTAHRHSGSTAVLCFWNYAQGQDVS